MAINQQLLLFFSLLTRTIPWPFYYTVHVYGVIFFSFYESMHSFWVKANLCRVFCCSFVHIYFRLKSNYQEGMVKILITGLTPPHFCTYSKTGPWFPTSYVLAFFVFSALRWEVIVRFIDIGGIDDHHCLNFLFVMRYINSLFPILISYTCISQRMPAYTVHSCEIVNISFFQREYRM